jgi:hypothetical protein
MWRGSVGERRYELSEARRRLKDKLTGQDVKTRLYSNQEDLRLTVGFFNELVGNNVCVISGHPVLAACAAIQHYGKQMKICTQGIGDQVALIYFERNQSVIDRDVKLITDDGAYVELIWTVGDL